MVLSIREEFYEVACGLGSGVAEAPSEDWRTVDDAHYDLNTCLREAIVVLKSFLVALPNDQLSVFEKSITAQLLAPHDAAPAGRRRMVLIERE
jgi:hypothetical protein